MELGRSYTLKRPVVWWIYGSLISAWTQVEGGENESALKGKLDQITFAHRNYKLSLDVNKVRY